MSLWHWIIVLLIVVLVFGTKRLTGGARDVGEAVREFKKGMRGDETRQLGNEHSVDVQEPVSRSTATDPHER